MTMQTVKVKDQELVILTREDFDALMEKAGVLPPLPPAAQDGSRDALAFADAAIARGVIQDRIQQGWTQKELAKRAGLRLETICRLESGKHAPTRETIARIEKAFVQESATGRR